MAEIIKETVVKHNDGYKAGRLTEVKRVATGTETSEYFIYFVLGAIEVLLTFRLIFKLAGASTASAFIQLIYSLSSIFVWPFEGIFRKGVTQGIETASVFEPSTIVAMLVYAVLAWGIIALLRIMSGEKQVD